MHYFTNTYSDYILFSDFLAINVVVWNIVWARIQSRCTATVQVSYSWKQRYTRSRTDRWEYEWMLSFGCQFFKNDCVSIWVEPLTLYLQRIPAGLDYFFFSSFEIVPLKVELAALVEHNAG